MTIIEGISDEKPDSESEENYLIEHNPLKAYTPKPKPKKDSETVKVFTDAYKELERMEEQTHGEEVFNPLIIKETHQTIQEDQCLEMEHQNVTMENKSEELQQDIVKESQGERTKSQSKEILSGDNKLYRQMAGKYASKIKSVEDVSINPNVVNKGIKIGDETTYRGLGMDDTEVQRFKNILTVSKEIKMRNMNSSKSPVMALGEVKKFKALVESKKMDSPEIDPSLPNINTFVHIYPKKKKVKHGLAKKSKSNPLSVIDLPEKNSDNDTDNLDSENVHSDLESGTDVDTELGEKTDADLEEKTDTDTDIEENISVEKNLLKTGVISEEILAQLKAEWENSLPKGQKGSKKGRK